MYVSLLFANGLFLIILLTNNNLLYRDKQPFLSNIEIGTSKPGSEIVGSVSVKHVYEIAKMKQLDQNLKNRELQAICKMIIGQARGLGIEVVY